MTSIVVEVAEILSKVNRPAAFCTAGTQQTLAPGLLVAGVGPVALPLLPMQAEQLVCTKNQASYERRRKQQAHDLAAAKTLRAAE